MTFFQKSLASLPEHHSLEWGLLNQSKVRFSRTHLHHADAIRSRLACSQRWLWKIIGDEGISHLARCRSGSRSQGFWRDLESFVRLTEGFGSVGEGAIDIFLRSNHTHWQRLTHRCTNFQQHYTRTATADILFVLQAPAMMTYLNEHDVDITCKWGDGLLRKTS